MTRNISEVPVGPIATIPPGEGRTFEVLGERVAIFRSRSGDLFASQADCPHRGGPLADGLLGGTTLICPLHAWKFDLSTGLAVAGECGIKTYPVRADGGQILLTLEHD